jgi:subtilisin family serine protease
VENPEKLTKKWEGQFEVVKFQPYNVIQTLTVLSGEEGNKNKNLYWAEVKLNTKLSNEEYLNKLKEWELDNEVLLASPFFKNEINDKIGLSNLFYVRLKQKSDFFLLQELVTKTNTKIVGANRFMPEVITLTCTKESNGNALELANYFEKTGHFLYAEPDLMTENMTECVNDPFFNNQWGLSNTGSGSWTAGMDIRACDAWSITKGSSTIVTAVLDHGIEMNHPDMSANIFGTGFNTATATSPALVLGSHGTACAGIVGAVDNNSLGVTGVAPNSKLMSISNSLTLYPNVKQDLASGMVWASQNGASIISNSWGHNTLMSAVIDNAINFALTQGRGGLGCVVVFATGNNNSAVIYPANSNPDILAVGAMSPCGERKNPSSWDGEGWGSNFGSQIDVVAPGVKIPTTDRQGAAGYTGTDYTQTFNGTSSACPHAAGVAALVLSVNPCLTQKQVVEIIESSSRKVGTYTYSTTVGRENGDWNNEMGYGLIDANAAVRLARSLYLQNKTITTTEVYQARDSVISGRAVTSQVPIGDFVVANGADVEFRASKMIQLENGFKVELGAKYSAIMTIAGNCSQWVSTANVSTLIVVNNPSPKLKTNTGESFDASSDEGIARLKKQTIVYPNPFNGRISIQYTIESEESDTKFEIYDLHGRLVQSLFDQKKARGVYTETFAVGNLPSQVYVIRTCIDGTCINNKLVKTIE